MGNIKSWLMRLNILKIRNIFSTDSFADVIESVVLSSTYREARKDTQMLKERQLLRWSS